jgi:hypothetical protein
MGAELAGLLVVLVVLVVLYQRRRNAEPVILGQELARARAVEAERIARGTSAPTPMPKEEYTARHSNLAAPQPIPLDSAIRDVVTRYRTADEKERAVIRDSITGDEQYTLHTFALRAAVFGIRERDPAWIESGLTAVAMFDVDRMDPRDVLVPAELLHHAGRRIGMDTQRLFTETAALAEARMGKGIAEYATWNESRLGSIWPREEIATGFVDRGSDR